MPNAILLESTCHGSFKHPPHSGLGCCPFEVGGSDVVDSLFSTALIQSALPRPIPQDIVESDHGCTFRIYFDNAGDNVTLTSQKPCLHNNKCDCSKTNGLN